MHSSELSIDTSLVSRLIAAQFPLWAHLPIRPVPSAGTDNSIYRLGEDMAVRMPRFKSVADHVEKEHRWLPKFGPHLPLTIPTPLAKGTLGQDYPWNWSIYRWIEGENATPDKIINLHQTATALGQFIAALQKIDPTDGPIGGEHNGFRGVPLINRDTETRAAIRKLSNVLDTNALTHAWNTALQAPAWTRPPVWLHGDLQSGNILTHQGKLNAVIDFGLMGIGDPAGDVMAAWTFLSAETREAFRLELHSDDATWARGRGWALSWGLIALAYYLNTNLVLASIARHTIDEVLSDS